MPNIVPDFYLPVDVTGNAFTNHIVSEKHDLPPTLVKCIVPNYGAYFTQTVEVYSVSLFNNTRLLLTKNIDYKCVEFLPKTSAEVNSEICFVILIINPNVSTQIEITYHALGGSDSPSKPLLLEIYNNFINSRQDIEWLEILNKPKQFVPTHHLHDSADVFGLEYISDELEYIKQSISLTDNKIHSYILQKLNVVNTLINTPEFKVVENIDINAQVAIIDNAKSNLTAANKHLSYVQLKYNLAEKFYNRVNELFLATGKTSIAVNAAILMQPTYSIFPSKTSVYEGDDFDFDLITTNVVNETVFYLKPYYGINNEITTITDPDLLTTLINPIKVINDFGKTICRISLDNIIEGNRFLTYGLYDTEGQLLALSRTIVINDLNIIKTNVIKYVPIDPYYNQVTLLLKGDGVVGSKLITDNSINPKIITSYGDVNIGTTYSDFGGGSLEFDGLGDYLRITPNSGVVLGVNDFTIETFIYFRDLLDGGFGNLATYADPVNIYGISVWINNGKINVQLGRSISSQFTEIKGNVSLVKNNWYHIAVSRQAGLVRLFINGLLDSSVVSLIDINNTNFTIGRTYPNNSGNYFNGYLDEFQITKGLSRYNSNFIPPIAIDPPNIIDPYVNNVSLNLNGSGINESGYIVDTGIFHHQINASSAAIISSEQYVDGLRSIHFKGNGSTYAYINHSRQLDLYDVNSWTIEFYIYLKDENSLFVLSKDGEANKAFPQYRVTANNKFISLMLSTGSNNSAVQILSTPNLPNLLGNWVHFAAVNNNKTLTLYVDGKALASQPQTGLMLSGNSKLTLGTEYGQKWEYDSYIDKLKITKGVARYTGNFSPMSGTLPIMGNMVTYSIVANKVRAFEGDTITFVVSTNDLNHNGYVDLTIDKVTDTFYTVDYSVKDLAPTKLYIRNGLGEYKIDVTKDNINELPEVFTVTIWKLNKYNVPLAVSANVTIINVASGLLPSPTFRITPNKEYINEGEEVAFNINTLDVVDDTRIYYTILGSSSQLDFAGSISGEITIVNNSAVLIITALEDYLTEGTEYINVLLYSNITRTKLIVTSKRVNIVDTSTNTTYIITPDIFTVNEGDTVVFNIASSPLPNGSQVFYRLIGSINVSDITQPLTARVVVNNRQASVPITLTKDMLLEGSETLSMAIYSEIQFINLLAVSPVVTVLDTSKPFNLLISVNEGVNKLYGRVVVSLPLSVNKGIVDTIPINVPITLSSTVTSFYINKITDPKVKLGTANYSFTPPYIVNDLVVDYATSILYPIQIEDSLNINSIAVNSGYIYSEQTEKFNIGTLQLVSGELTDTIVYKTQNINNIETFNIGTLQLVSGELTDTIVYKTQNINNIETFNINSLELISGSLDTTIVYVTYNTPIENFKINALTITSGTLE